VDDLLHLFGTATGLKTNIQKSSVSPTQCSEQDLAVVQTYFPCEIQDFPCKYLGLPLSNKMLTSAQLLLLIERIADQLHGWKVQSVLTSVLVYYATALELPPWCL
jgi:hypothetical protein